MLIDKAVGAATAKDRACKIAYSRGLKLPISASGHTSWRCNYRFEGKNVCSHGVRIPDVSLAETYKKRAEAKKILSAGRNCRHNTARNRLAGPNDCTSSLEYVAPRGMRCRLTAGSLSSELIESFERDVYPRSGSMPLEGFEKTLLLPGLRKYDNRRAIESSRRIKQ